MSKKTVFRDFTTADGKTWTTLGWRSGKSEVVDLYTILVSGGEATPEEFTNSAIALVGKFLQHYELIRSDKGHTSIRYMEESESRHGAGISEIFSNNVRYTVMSPPERIAIPSPMVPAPYGLRVKHLLFGLERLILKNFKVKVDVYNTSFHSNLNLTTPEARGIAFGKLCNNKLTVDISDEVLVRALKDVTHRYELTPEHRIAVPTFHFKALFNIDFQAGKKAGFTTVTNAHPGSLTKGEAFYHEVFVLLSLISEMERLYDSNLDHTANVMTLYEYLSEILIILKKLSLKSEIIKIGKNHYKARIFVLVPLIHYMIAKIISEPLHEYLSPRFEYGVGFRWFGGGAKLLYDKLKGEEGDIIFDSKQGVIRGPDVRTFYSDDISGKDTRFKARDLILLILLTASIFDFEGVGQHFHSAYDKECYKKRACILLTFVIWLAMNTAFHNVNWDRSWRIIIGCLASGDYNTSHLNTIHMVLLIYAFCIWTYNKAVAALEEKKNTLSPKKFQKELQAASKYRYAVRSGALCFAVQGDNLLWSCHDDVADLMNHDTMEEFFKLADMGLKESDAKTARTLIDELTPEGEFKYDRPDYLQRHLMVEKYNGKFYLVPVRAFSDHVKSLYHNSNEMNDVEVYVAKVVSIICDSMGANETIYTWLRYYLSFFFVNNENRQFLRRVYSHMDSDDNVKLRRYKYGIRDLDASGLFNMAIDRDKLFRRLVGIDSSREDIYSQQTFYDYRPMPESQY